MPPTRAGQERPFAGSLCWRCTHHRPITAPRSVFVLCTALPVKYPPQPVSTCPMFRPTPGTI